VITSSGPMCDICGNYILPIDPEERVHEFSIKQFPGMKFHCDNKCKQAIIDSKGDWKLLPDGPIKREYERINKEISDKSAEHSSATT
jgi:hypothetical protein